ncbi:MAG: HIT domain-containing protein [Mariprofundaceae bacterium]
MSGLILHAQLKQDCHVLGRFPLSLLLLLDDAQYPWCILVPQRQDVREIHHLPEADQQQLLRESVALAQAMERVFAADKMNVAALGNVVPQLHVHHIARFRNDPAWPAPVWGRLPPLAYAPDELKLVREKITGELLGNQSADFQLSGN